MNLKPEIDFGVHQDNDPKAHKCHWCGRMIEAGAPFVDSKCKLGYVDEDWDFRKFHPECYTDFKVQARRSKND